MGIKRFVLFTIIFFGAVGGGFFYYVDNSMYTLNIPNMPTIAMPLAVLILVVGIVFFIFTLLHLFFYSAKNYFANRAKKSDKANMVKLISEIMLDGNAKKYKFKTKEFKSIASVLSQMTITTKDLEFSTDEEGLKSTFDVIKRVKSGSYVPKKELDLPITNKLMEENTINKIKADVEFCIEVLKKSQNYTQRLIKVAFMTAIETKSLTTFKKFLNKLDLDRDMIVALFEKDAELRGSFSLTNDEIATYCKKADFTKADFFMLNKIYKNKISPDELIKMIKDINAKFESAFEAYIYTLLDYEMVDIADDLLTTSEKHQYLPYKALIDLKNSGKHYCVDVLCPTKY
jgi:hypothetical protein